MSAARVDRIRAALERAFAPAHVQVRDDSHKHVGHAGAGDGRGHFHVTVVSPALDSLTPLARHRAVYAALGDMLQTDIHALSIDVRASGQAPRSA